MLLTGTIARQKTGNALAGGGSACQSSDLNHLKVCDVISHLQLRDVLVFIKVTCLLQPMRKRKCITKREALIKNVILFQLREEYEFHSYTIQTQFDIT